MKEGGGGQHPTVRLYRCRKWDRTKARTRTWPCTPYKCQTGQKITARMPLLVDPPLHTLLGKHLLGKHWWMVVVVGNYVTLWAVLFLCLHGWQCAFFFFFQGSFIHFAPICFRNRLPISIFVVLVWLVQQCVLHNMFSIWMISSSSSFHNKLHGNTPKKYSLLSIYPRINHDFFQSKIYYPNWLKLNLGRKNWLKSYHPLVAFHWGQTWE